MPNLSPREILTLALIYAPPDKWSILASQQLMNDLGIYSRPMIDHGMIQQIIANTRQYPEHCLCCLQPTGFGLSYDMLVGCPNCFSTAIERREKLWYLWRELGLDLEGHDRRILFQYIYSILEKIGVIK